MKIYTKTGDSGTTGLFGGGRVSKNSPRINAYGEVDELNSLLGVAAAESSAEPVEKALIEIQNHLFTVGAQLASPSGAPNIEVITSAQVDFLERQMDAMMETLPEMKSFILPGGSKTSAHLHVARCVCRRAERSVVHLEQLPDEQVDKWVLIYLNRLSDFLFTCARLSNQLDGVDDVAWLGMKANKK